MEFVGVMAAAIFEAAGFSMGFVVRPTTGHSIALVQFMEKHIAPLFSSMASSIQTSFSGTNS
jgi:hypothetical protein